MSEHYLARGNEVYYCHPVNLTEELFLTVHPVRDSSMTVEEQAVVLARMLEERGVE